MTARALISPSGFAAGLCAAAPFGALADGSGGYGEAAFAKPVREGDTGIEAIIHTCPSLKPSLLPVAVRDGRCISLEARGPAVDGEGRQ